MNRKERRRAMKHMKGNVILPKDDKPADYRDNVFCPHHPHLQLENPKNPTPRDLGIIEGIRLTTRKTEQPDGTIKVTKHCPRCHIVINVGIINRPLLAN